MYNVKVEGKSSVHVYRDLKGNAEAMFLKELSSDKQINHQMKDTFFNAVHKTIYETKTEV